MDQTDLAKHILIVDDDESNLDLLETYLKHAGYRTTRATDGDAAKQILSSVGSKFDAVLSDRIMPNTNGIELIRYVKSQEHLRDIPVIMQTSASTETEIMEGLAAGAFHYVTKPFNINLLLSVVKTAIDDFVRYKTMRAEMKRTSLAVELLADGFFHYRTIEEAKQLASFLSSACPKPHAVVIGLSELLINAVEHGNLNFSYSEKSALLSSQEWAEAIEQRIKSPEFNTKKVVVEFKRDKNEISFTITDQGGGFDWKPYMTLDPARAFDAHGRGIAMAAMLSFSSIHYQGKGNEVIARVKLPDKQLSPN